MIGSKFEFLPCKLVHMSCFSIYNSQTQDRLPSLISMVDSSDICAIMDSFDDNQGTFVARGIWVFRNNPVRVQIIRLLVYRTSDTKSTKVGLRNGNTNIVIDKTSTFDLDSELCIQKSRI